MKQVDIKYYESIQSKLAGRKFYSTNTNNVIEFKGNQFRSAQHGQLVNKFINPITDVSGEIGIGNLLDGIEAENIFEVDADDIALLEV